MGDLVSVIIPSYNKNRYIKTTINSVVTQTYTNWELIIIDDCSNDGTIDIIRECMESDSRIKLYTNAKNEGANYSRNFGIERANGTYIVFLDADDLLKFDCLEKRVEFIENSALDFCIFTMGVFVHTIGDSTYQWVPNSERPLKDFLQHKLPWSILQPIWKKDFLVKIGGFDPEFERLQDVELHTRALLFDEVKFKLIPMEPDCYYRVDEKRRNFKAFDFYDRWVKSTTQYYIKFYGRCGLLKLNRYLIGTIHATYLQVLNARKKNEITESELSTLENKLLNNLTIEAIHPVKRTLLKITRVYNLLSYRIPGINWLIKKCLVDL